MLRKITPLLLLFLSCGHLNEAHKSYELGEYRDTIRICRAAIEADSTDHGAYGLLARAYLAAGRRDSALTAFQRAGELEPDNAEYIEGQYRIHLSRGDDFSAASDHRSAIREYKSALSLLPDSLFVIEKIGDVYVQAGQHKLALEQYEQAATGSRDPDALERKIAALVDKRRESDQHLDRARSAVEAKRYAEASRALEKALETTPDHEDALYLSHMVKGHRLYRKGSVSELWDAIAEYGYAATLRPDLGEPHYYMARAYNKKDRDEFSNAISAYEKAAEVEPDGPLAGEARAAAAELRRREKLLREFWGK